MNEKEQLIKCKTISDAARILFDINYTNGKIKEKIVKTCFEKYDIDILEIISNNKKKFCKNCGKEIFGDNKFCSQSCAASYNNKKRALSEETKQKISKTLLKENFETKGKIGKKHPYLKRYLYPHICEKCKKEFFTAKKNQRFCSVKCAQSSDEVKEKLRNIAKEKVKNGTHSGWKSRNVQSYAEAFWEKVLQENSIEYIKEDYSTKKYFLDFLITKNRIKIDLEIDGKQHFRKDRQEHDKIRDEFLSKNGFVVYRIKWNEINTEDGKLVMAEKINNFISFYEKI